MIKKITASVLSLLLLASPLTVCAMPYEEYMRGRGTYQATTYELSPGLTYTEVLSSNEKYGYEQSYIYHYIPGKGTEIRPVFGDTIYGTNALKTLTEKAEQNGDRVVGGINGDFYGMSTGIPLGMMIVDGEIITSDNERSALGFDSDGKAFISYPNMQTTLKNDTYELKIDHINKTPGEYGVYLLTDTYNKTTTSKKSASELVLMPYSDVKEYKTERDMPRELPENAFVYLYEEKQEEITENPEETGDSENSKTVSVPETDTKESDKEEARPDGATASPDGTVTEADEKKDETETDEKGGKESAGEKVKEKEEGDLPDAPFYARVYTLSEEKLHIGCDLAVVVREIRTDSVDSEIPAGYFVLSAENVNQKYRVDALSEGEELSLSVTANEEWYKAVSAIGNSGGFILKNGEYCDDVEMAHYPYAHPRTAVGITAEGDVIFYCVDGRKNGTSGGMRIDQLSHEMKNLGCVTAMNLDGGGSTTAYVALPGAKHAVLRNTPSDGRERKTANSILFVNTAGRSGTIEYCEMPEQNAYILAGGSHYTIGRPIATDRNRYPIDLANELTYEYFLKEEDDGADGQNRILDGNIFVSGDKGGNADIYVRITLNDVEREFFAGTVYVLDVLQDFSFEKDIEISIFDSAVLPFAAKYHTVKLNADVNSLLWAEYTPNEPTLDEEGNEIPAEPTDLTALSYSRIPSEGILETDGVILSADGTVTPKNPDTTVYLAAKFGDIYKTFCVKSLPYPFSDSINHWAARTLYLANHYGLMQGEPSEEGMIFSPERNMSKTEFFIVLARMLYPDMDNESTAAEEEENESGSASASVDAGENTVSDSASSDSEISAISAKNADNEGAEGIGEPTEPIEPETEFSFTDAQDIPFWAKKYYDKLEQSGLLDFITETDENGVRYMYPNAPITRRQVLIMLGALCEESEVDFIGVFTDTEYLQNDPYKSFINNAIASEIFLGYTDGTLKPENNLTRAEAATVIVRFCEEHKMAN